MCVETEGLLLGELRNTFVMLFLLATSLMADRCASERICGLLVVDEILFLRLFTLGIFTIRFCHTIFSVPFATL